MSALIPLVVVWLIVLVPSAVRSRAERRREFIGSFHRQLGALEASSAWSVGVDMTAAEPSKLRRRSAAQRRRTIFVGLLLSMIVTAVPLLVFPGKLALVVHLAVDNCFLLYVGLLVRWRDTRGAALAPITAATDTDALVLAPRVGAAISA